MTLDRRNLLVSLAAAPMFAGSGRAFAGVVTGHPSVDRIDEDLRRYIGFGMKASGGVGDNASGNWIAEELARSGYSVERSSFQAPFFDPRAVELRLGEKAAVLIPQAIVRQTSAEGVTGPLFRFDPSAPAAIPAGAIVMVDLPRRNWSTATDPVIRQAVAACEGAGAIGAVLLTNGPTDEAIALNAPGDKPLFALPVASLAPRDAEPFLSAARDQASATLTITGRSGRREAFNIAGRYRAPGATKNVIITTPRSGWLTCAAERGPGVAIWLDLMRWLPTSGLALNVVFSSNSGHEYENLGASHQIGSNLPKPEETALFLLFGAGVVTRAIEQRDESLVPLATSARRSCIVTDPASALARAVFTAWDGWSDPDFVKDGGAGEAGTAIRSGYPNVIGFVGANPYHHVAGDTGGNVDSALIRRVAHASRTLLSLV